MFLSTMFNCKGSNFERLITHFITLTVPIFKRKMIDIVERKYTTTKLNERGIIFEKYPHARYATEVRFQKSNRPSGDMQESHPWYSGKHTIHRYKFEASILPIALCLSFSQHARGGRSNL